MTLRVNVYDANGGTIASNLTYALPALSYSQWTLPVEVDHGSMEFFVVDPTNRAVVFPTASTIDQYSGDPTYQSPTLLATARTLFPEAAAAAAASNSTTGGRKFTLNEARQVRAGANHRGQIKLQETRDER